MTELQRKKWFLPGLAGVLYFSQGFPFGVFEELMPLYLRTQGVSLTQIGLFSSIGAAWTWKVLWSPLVDLYGSYRRWIAGALIALSTSIAALAILPASQTQLLWWILIVLAFASATQDIAIDALTVRITPTRLLGYINSIRVAAYRGAMIVAGGGLAALTPLVGWPGAFAIGAILMASVLLFTYFMPSDRGVGIRHENPFRGLVHWMQRPRAGILLLIALLYRIGDAALVRMVKPFWIDRGYSAAEVGTVTTIIGISLLIAGAFVGGAFVSRYGIYKALLWLGLAQVLSNIGYAIAASSTASRPVMYSVAMVENFCGGLGTAAFLAYLMSICDREHAATQYAMLSALFALARTLIGTVSGVAADQLGYVQYFWLTLAFGIPGLALLPLVKREMLVPPSRSEIVAEA
ncbi:MAG TPA: MFS transporter [Thermoanaerobaculia bacterium]|nr:MFS transporter [Thermoanaerobaculia bacterium]